MTTVLQPMSNCDQQHSKGKPGSVLLSPFPVPAFANHLGGKLPDFRGLLFGVFFFGFSFPIHTYKVVGYRLLCSSAELIAISAMATF